ncbi:MAG: relaxase/mobilization nuclease domain-containing protein [Clostridiales bacterium]|jgi:hypothetical protein|nr:relaxase/mobilization nuclease domain-containing protein [Clostridiales bacterium]
MFALHVNKGKTIAGTISVRTDYAADPGKTRGGELVTGYECDPHTADIEFLLSKQQYLDITGRDQGRHNVLAYHIRQSFKPGEIAPEAANRLGRELALRFTRGRHAFIVATHIDKHHIHNHIIFNSVNIDCDGKFRDFKQSGRAVRRISDQICLENGLSIIENASPSHGHYGAPPGIDKEPTLRQRLEQAIDAALAEKPSGFDGFLKLMGAAGYEVKRGKHTSFKGSGSKGFIRPSSLGNDYTEDAIRERIADARTVPPKEKPAPALNPQTDNLLMQIQRCVKPKGSPGYDRWAAIFNLKQIAKTFSFLQENNLLDYDKLAEKAQQAKDGFNAASTRIKAIDVRLPEISSLQKHIGVYGKTKEIYAEYRKSGKSKKFYATHEHDIELNKAAKRAFDALGLEKLPSIKTLQTEYASLLSEKKALYGKYKEARQYMQDILTVQQNARELLGYSETEKPQQTERI